MEIDYHSNEVEKYFTNYKKIQRKKGFELARSVKKRVDQLAAAPTFQEYIDIGLGSPHSLTGNLKGWYGVDVKGNYKLLIRPDSDDLTSESLKKCKKAIIGGVVDYHGSKTEIIIP